MRINPFQLYRRAADDRMYLHCPMCNSPHTWDELRADLTQTIAGQPVALVRCAYCHRSWTHNIEHLTATPVDQDSRT